MSMGTEEIAPTNVTLHRRLHEKNAVIEMNDVVFGDDPSGGTLNQSVADAREGDVESGCHGSGVHDEVVARTDAKILCKMNSGHDFYQCGAEEVQYDWERVGKPQEQIGAEMP
jgi:hypothetical protein